MTAIDAWFAHAGNAVGVVEQPMSGHGHLLRAQSSSVRHVVHPLQEVAQALIGGGVVGAAEAVFAAAELAQEVIEPFWRVKRRSDQLHAG
jgi:hypothetical protein